MRLDPRENLLGDPVDSAPAIMNQDRIDGR